MRRPIVLLTVSLVLLVGCGGGAVPTQAPAQQPPAAQPTQASQPTEAAAPVPAQPTQFFFPTAAPAARPTLPPAATGRPDLRPPQSGGVLNPPTLIPTRSGNTAVTSGQTGWNTLRDPASGLTFQYPADWRQAINPAAVNPKALTERIQISHLSQPAGHNAIILIDVRRSPGNLLAWVKQQLPTGSLMLDSNTLEGGLKNLTDYNAKLNSLPAIFVYQPEHGSGTPDMAALFAADKQNVYQLTYHGDIPDDSANRLVYLRLLNTVTLSGTTTSGITLPQTAFTNGIDLSQIK